VLSHYLSESVPALPDTTKKDPTLFEKYLHEILNLLGELIWNYPRILSFFDDTASKPSIRDAHLVNLTQKVNIHFDIIISNLI
jgi:hypothetical protein